MSDGYYCCRDPRMMEAFLRKGDAYRFDGVRGVPLVPYAHPETRAIAPVGQLERTDGGFAFSYVPGAAELEDFRPFLGFPDVSVRYRSRRLFPL